MAFFPEDDLDPISQGRRLGQHFMIAAPGPQREPVELPGIEMPAAASNQQSAVSTQPKTGMGSPDVAGATNATSVTKPSMGGIDHPITGSPDHRMNMADPLEQDRQQHQAKLEQYRREGSGIHQIHNPFLRTMARVGDIAGSMFFPYQMAAIPGTELHHRQLMGQESGAINQDLGEQHSQAQTEQERAQTAHTQAETETLKNPQPKPKEEQWEELKDFTGPNGEPLQMEKNSGQVRIAGGDILGIKSKAAQPKEGELPLGDRVAQLNAAMQRRYQVLNPNQKLPEDLTLQPNATAKDFDRIDKIMQQTEGAQGTKASQEQSNAIRREMLALANKKEGRAETAAKDKETKPLQQSIDDAEQAHTLAQMGDAGNAEADVDLALSFFKTMRSGGQGIRFTRQEQDLIIGARSSAQDLLGVAQKVFGSGQKFTPEQRAQIVKVIDVHADAARRALQRIQSGEEAPAGGGGGAMIKVQIPGQKPGQIPASAKAQFMKDHPNAQVLP